MTFLPIYNDNFVIGTQFPGLYKSSEKMLLQLLWEGMQTGRCEKKLAGF
jgi:hypothetical protein